MKKLLMLPVLALIAFSFTLAPTTYNVDAAASNIGWVGYKVTGQHNGNVKIQSGTLQIENGVLKGGSFTVDMNSITCLDTQGEWGDKLVGHLKSEDFFGTAKYPTSSFVITRAIPVDTKGNYKLIGNLTIKSTTKEVKFNATVTESNGMVTASGKLTVDRSEFDVRYGSGSFFDGLGDKTIYDNFDLNISLTAKK